MSLTRRAAVGFVVLTLVSCEKKPAQPDAGIQGFIQSAIYMQGGLAQVKKASSFSANYEATLLGTKLRGQLQHRPGMQRLAFTGPTRDPVVQVAAENACWQMLGQAVLPCLAPLRAHTTHLGQLLEASWLWPLAERKDRKVTVERAAGKGPAKLTVAGAGGESIGTLLVSSEGQVVGLEMQTTLGGKTGAFVGTFGAFEKSCGATVATERRYTFLGQPFATEKLANMICETPDEKLFAQPEQVKHGTVEPKIMASIVLLCTKLKGALTGVDAAITTVMDQAQKRELAITGAAVLVHRKGPPLPPAQYLTDVCLPVDKRVLSLPESTWKGSNFFVSDLADQRAVAAYGIGDLDKTTPELAKLLIERAKKLGHQPDSPLYQFVFMRAADLPGQQRVSELHLPVVE